MPLIRRSIATVAALLTLAACGSASTTENSDTLIPSIAATDVSTSASTATGDVEQELLDYVACLRGQGLDIPDPQVDANGVVQMGRPTGGGPGIDFDLDAFEAAQKVCGPIPAGALGGIDLNQPELQDQAVEFAQCMRDHDLDVADPDLSKGIMGAAAAFSKLDMSDPTVQAALRDCQQQVFNGTFPGAPTVAPTS